MYLIKDPVHCKYSKPSNNRCSIKWTTSVQWDRSLATDWFYRSTNTFQTSEKQTPLNSVQWTLISPRLTLTNTKLPPKADSETTPTDSLYIMRTLVIRFRKIAYHHRWIQRLGIISALLLIMLPIIQQRRGPNVWPHRAQEPDHTLPHLPEVYRIFVMKPWKYFGYK